MSTSIETSPSETTEPRRKSFFASLWVQVLIAMAIAVALGYLSPANAVAMKPLGDAFIRLITMIITVLIFCTVVTGIAGMQDLKKVGRVGGKALLYFEIVSTIALAVGLVVGNVVHPGSGFKRSSAYLVQPAHKLLEIDRGHPVSPGGNSPFSCIETMCYAEPLSSY